jgi:hypothetical protein
MSPKPAYEVLHDLIKGKWWTRTEVKTAGEGRATLDGFFGEYELTARYAGRETHGKLALEPGLNTTVEVALS